MSDTDTTHVDDVLELAALLRPAWPTISAGIAASGVPTCEGDDEDDKKDDDTSSDKTPEQLKAEAEKWKALARKHEKNAKDNATAATELKELKDADKSDADKAKDDLAAAEKRASAAESKLARIEVALDKAPKGLDLAKVRKLAGRLSGDSREDLEADADDLFADFAPDTGADDDEDKGKDDAASRSRPRERLRSGSTPSSEPEETDPDKLAASVPRPY